MMLKHTALVITTLALLVSCQNTGFKKTETGLKYRFITQNPNNSKPVPGDIVAIKFKYTNAKNQVIDETGVFRTQLAQPDAKTHTIDEALALMHKGDSAHFLINAESYYTFKLKRPLPDSINPNEDLHFYIKLIDITPFSEFEQERQADLLSGEREEDKLLTDFLQRANITSEPTTSGLYYVEQKKGTGDSPKPGRKVAIDYVAYFIDGQVFDNSYERQKPFVFTHGVGEVIQGLDEGIARMKTGGKAKLVIHSSLAYGAEGAGPVKPFTTLVFEVELLKVWP